MSIWAPVNNEILPSTFPGGPGDPVGGDVLSAAAFPLPAGGVLAAPLCRAWKLATEGVKDGCVGFKQNSSGDFTLGR